MPAAVPNLPTLPKYTVLSSTYSTFKDTWAAGKNYRIVSTVESVTETVASKVVSLTSKYTKASTLGELDVIIRPSLVTADVKVSPYIENGITTGLEQKKKVSALTDLVAMSIRTADAFVRNMITRTSFEAHGF